MRKGGKESYKIIL